MCGGGGQYWFSSPPQVWMVAKPQQPSLAVGHLLWQADLVAVEVVDLPSGTVFRRSKERELFSDGESIRAFMYLVFFPMELTNVFF